MQGRYSIGNSQELEQHSRLHQEGNKIRAKAIYNHLKVNHQQHIQEDLDQREKWPMLVPLLILYTLGTLGVLGLVFGFLASEMDWW